MATDQESLTANEGSEDVTSPVSDTKPVSGKQLFAEEAEATEENGVEAEMDHFEQTNDELVEAVEEELQEAVQPEEFDEVENGNPREEVEPVQPSAAASSNPDTTDASAPPEEPVSLDAAPPVPLEDAPTKDDKPATAEVEEPLEPQSPAQQPSTAVTTPKSSSNTTKKAADSAFGTKAAASAAAEVGTAETQAETAPVANGNDNGPTVISVEEKREEGAEDAPNVKELSRILSTKVGAVYQSKLAPPPEVTKSESLARKLSEHDTANTANVALLLKQGTFKYQPLQDFLPYDDLLTMRLEDGIDVTRKEDYLSEEEFTKVFGMNREAFLKTPAWKRQQAKKKVSLF